MGYYTWDKVRHLMNNKHLFGRLVGKDAWTPVHGEWMDYLYSGTEAKSLMAHRGSFKTSCITEMLPLLWLMNNPNARIAVCKKTFTSAAESVRNIANIASVPAMAELIEFVVGEKWKFSTNKEGRLGFSFKKTLTKETSIEALSTTSAFTGRHYDILIFDDIIDVTDRLSEAEREHTKIVVQEMRTNVLDPTGKLVAAGTPWHIQDAWECLPPPRKYDIYQTGLLTPEQIETKRGTLSPLLFACNYELDFANDANALFGEAMRGVWHGDKLRNIQAHLDTAFDGDHYNALTIAGSFPDGRINAVGFVYAGNVKDWLPEIARKVIQYGAKRFFIESNADKEYTADLFKLNQGLRDKHVWIRPYDEHTNKHLKICSYGVEAWKSTEWAEETHAEYLTQCLFYSEKAEPDDAPDSFASLIREGNYSITRNYASNFLNTWKW